MREPRHREVVCAAQGYTASDAEAVWLWAPGFFSLPFCCALQREPSSLSQHPGRFPGLQTLAAGGLGLPLTGEVGCWSLLCQVSAGVAGGWEKACGSCGGVLRDAGQGTGGGWSGPPKHRPMGGFMPPGPLWKGRCAQLTEIPFLSKWDSKNK